ncbi:MAG: hypothetical protein KAX78_07350 [Phycisphaerae bacterium]|nr:hypothetical protein [Phycisphaerae bacterium]
MKRRRYISLVVLAALLVGLGVGVVIWHLCRLRSKPTSQPASKGLIPGVDIPFEVKKAYIDKDGRIINPNDCDGDSLPDDWEMRRFGTLKYHPGNHLDAPRIDEPPRKVDPEDIDDDNLPDKWEMKYFGHLRYGWYDDPDEDGWPNHMELNNQKSGLTADPTQIDLNNPEGRPGRGSYPRGYHPYNKRAFRTSTREFWRKQDAAREKLLRQGGKALVRARRMKQVRRPGTKPAPPASARPSG